MKVVFKNKISKGKLRKAAAVYNQKDIDTVLKNLNASLRKYSHLCPLTNLETINIVLDKELPGGYRGRGMITPLDVSLMPGWKEITVYMNLESISYSKLSAKRARHPDGDTISVAQTMTHELIHALQGMFLQVFARVDGYTVNEYWRVGKDEYITYPNDDSRLSDAEYKAQPHEADAFANEDSLGRGFDALCAKYTSTL